MYDIRCIELTPNKTYATRENVIKAVEKKLGTTSSENLAYFIHTHTDGRFFPVFCGERALRAGIHFHFNLVA